MPPKKSTAAAAGTAKKAPGRKPAQNKATDSTAKAPAKAPAEAPAKAPAKDRKASAQTTKASNAKQAAKPAPKKEKTPVKDEAPAEPKPRGRAPKRKQEAVTPDVEPQVNGSAQAAAAEAAAAEPRPVKRPKLTKRAIINHAPTQKLNVYVCGEVSAGELGLGPEVKKVKRPRLNAKLLPDSVGVVQVATGGMHALALTHDNKIYTWGVNDKGALGRDTTWEGDLVDMANADDASDADMNPLESTPAPISEEHFPENTVFTQVAAGDSISFALTDDGRVYGWGTFRSNDGALGFTLDKEGKVIMDQKTPVLLPSLTRITQIACGADHALACDDRGHLYAWGNGQQCQLGRRVIERTKTQSLLPAGVSIPRRKVAAVGCGSFHSFAIDKSGQLWGWGLNSFGETGIPLEEDEEAGSMVALPHMIESLEGKKIKTVQGGSHHSVGVSEDGECLVWGRVDVGQCGIDVSSLPDEDVVKDHRGQTRILSIPKAVPNIKVATATAGSDHTIAVTTDGKAYSWGFNATYQTGQGGDDDDPDDIMLATMIDNTALREANVNWAGAGGQFSIITAIP
ncbi:MAG: hypothetical protein M1821_005821 [Bathelium mastoideum]|nr:MAG: hypothetical protein M1821_005821 [Bathelium mastoideum]